MTLHHRTPSSSPTKKKGSFPGSKNVQACVQKTQSFLMRQSLSEQHQDGKRTQESILQSPLLTGIAAVSLLLVSTVLLPFCCTNTHITTLPLQQIQDPPSTRRRLRAQEVFATSPAALANSNSPSNNYNTMFLEPQKNKEEEDAVGSFDLLETAPLKPIDYRKYTARVNTWKRPDQLRIVVHHLLSCPTVAQVQIVWCTAQGPVPQWLWALEKQQMHNGINKNNRVVVELHEDNSLNARFDIIHEPPTAGILSIDDDVLRPCEAIDAGFALWTMNPNRMVGFDARRIEMGTGKATAAGKASTAGPNNKKQVPAAPAWKYSHLSQTKRFNEYALVLTRFAFIHKDYLRQYTTIMPESIRQRVARDMNCEDIAMSLWVSSVAAKRAESSAPLLADFWAMETLVKLPSPHAISGTSNHFALRNGCVNDFAELLGLKQQQNRGQNSVPLVQNVEWLHHGIKQGDEFKKTVNEQRRLRSLQGKHQVQKQDSSSVMLRCGVQGAPFPSQQTPATIMTTTARSTAGVHRAAVVDRLVKRRQKWIHSRPEKIEREVKQLKRKTQLQATRRLTLASRAAAAAEQRPLLRQEALLNQKQAQTTNKKGQKY